MHLFNNDRLRLLITDKCNYKCLYCHNEGQYTSGHFMPIEFVNKFKDWLITNGINIRSLTISGGEPTLHPDLVKIVQLLKDTANKISIVTNGEFISRQLIDNVFYSGLDYLKFGIDSLWGNTTKPIKAGSNSDPQKIIANVLYACEKMPGSEINAVVSSFNQDKIRSLIKWCDKNNVGLKFLELIEMQDHPKKDNSREVPIHAWFSNLFANISDIVYDVEYDPEIMKFYAKTRNGQIVQFSENFCSFGRCGRLWTRINSTCKLVPCIKSAEVRNFHLSNDGIKMVNATNQEMRITSKWPCNLSLDQRKLEDFQLRTSDGNVLLNIKRSGRFLFKSVDWK